MEDFGKRMDAAEQQIQALREDLNQRFDQLVEMIRVFLLLPMTKIHQRGKNMFLSHRRRIGHLEAKTRQRHVEHTLRRPTYAEASEGEDCSHVC